jgi:hypothetical protein
MASNFAGPEKPAPLVLGLDEAGETEWMGTEAR